MDAMTTSRSKRRQAERRHLRAGAVAVLAILAVTYAAFGDGLPFQHHDEIRAVFTTANQLRPENPVRLAGVDIGKVTSIQTGPRNTSLVKMRLDRLDGLHADASLKIEPRLFFEGNFYVKVDPGTPGAPPLRSGTTIPLQRTAVPVQLDQVLNTFDAPTRGALKRWTAQTADGLGGAGGKATGYEGARRATRELDRALVSFEQAARASRGTQPGDLGRAVGSSSNVTDQLARDPAALAGLVTSFDRVTGALASRDRSLAAGIHELDGVMRVAPRTLSALDGALPVTTRFARALRPALVSAPVALRKSNRMLTQVAALMHPRELPALLHDLDPVTAAFPTLEQRLVDLFPLVTSVGRCVSDVVVPALDQKVPDGTLSTGDPAWLDMLHMATNAIGAGPSVDGNGTTVRVGVAEGEQSLQGFLPGVGNVVASGQIEGVRPTWLGYGVDPPWRPDQPCDRQQLPNLGARSGGPPAWLRPGPRLKPDAAAQSLLSELFTKGPHAVLRTLRARLPKPVSRARRSSPKQHLPAKHPAVALPRPPAVPDRLPQLVPDPPRVPALPKTPELPPPPNLPEPNTAANDPVHSLLGPRGGR
jgi:virulence factor Mce-like protein